MARPLGVVRSGASVSDTRPTRAFGSVCAWRGGGAFVLSSALQWKVHLEGKQLPT